MGYTIAADKIIFALSGGIGTLQDAINQAQTSRLPLFISPGNYATGDLVISAPVEIYATPGTVQLQPASTVNGFTLNIRSNTAGTFINDVTIQGVGFYGALLPFSAAVVYSQRWIMDHYTLAGNFNAIISAYQVTRLLIRDCNISYSGSNGIAMWQCTATINNNNFGGNVLCAIYSCDAWATTITDNYVHEGQNAGIGVCRQTPAFDGTIVRGNRVYQILAKSGAATGQVSGSGWFGNGIVVLNAYDIVIDGNVTNNCVFSGIRVDSSWNAQILGNQIIQSGETALFVEAPGGTPGETNPFGYHGGIVANNIVVTAGRGIAVGNTFRDGRRVVISGNSVSNITRNNIFSSYARKLVTA